MGYSVKKIRIVSPDLKKEVLTFHLIKIHDKIKYKTNYIGSIMEVVI